MPPFNQLGIGSCKLKMMKSIANLLIKEAVIAFVLFSNCIKNIGMIETIPKIIPAISPLANIVHYLFFLIG
jgi:hypothetical protein